MYLFVRFKWRRRKISFCFSMFSKFELTLVFVYALLYEPNIRNRRKLNQKTLRKDIANCWFLPVKSVPTVQVCLVQHKEAGVLLLKRCWQNHSCSAADMEFRHSEDLTIYLFETSASQMMSDEYRGWAWTRAFLGLQADEIHVCGDPSALPLIRNLCNGTGDDLVEYEYERFMPLKVEEVITFFVPRPLDLWICSILSSCHVFSVPFVICPCCASLWLYTRCVAGLLFHSSQLVLNFDRRWRNLWTFAHIC